MTVDIETWRARAGELWERCRDGEDRGVFTRRIDRFLATLPPDFSSWGRAQTVALGTVVGRVDENDHDAKAARCILAAYALESGDVDVLCAADREHFALSPPAGAPAPAAVLADDGAPEFTATFAFLYHARTRDGTRHLKGTGVARARRVAADDAPLLLTLPFSNVVGQVEVREHEGVTYRSLLAPEEREDGRACALYERDLARACSGAVPWADDPWAMPYVPGALRLAIDEVATDDAPSTAKGASARAQAEATSRERAGTLISVDGRLFVRTEEPRLRVCVASDRATPQTTRDPRVRIEWTCGTLSSTREPSSFPCVPKVAYLHGFVDAFLFPPSNVALAVDVARRVAQAGGIPLSAGMAEAFSGWPDETPDGERLLASLAGAAEWFNEHRWVGRIRDAVTAGDASLPDAVAAAMADPANATRWAYSPNPGTLANDAVVRSVLLALADASPVPAQDEDLAAFAP